MVCHNCGKEIEDTSKFCKFCGSPTKKDIAPTEYMDKVLPAPAASNNVPPSTTAPDTKAQPTLETQSSAMRQKKVFAVASICILALVAVIAVMFQSGNNSTGTRSNIDINPSASSEFNTPMNTNDTSTATLVSNIKLPEPDPNAHSMPTFYYETDIPVSGSMTDEWAIAFIDKYKETRVRICYTQGQYIKIGDKEYIDEGATLYEVNTNYSFYLDEVGPDGYVIEGVVSTNTPEELTDGHKLKLIDCYASINIGGNMWWLDDDDIDYEYTEDNIYGITGSPGDNGDSDYDDYYNYGEPIAVDARAVGNNVTRFLYNYDGQYIQLSNAYVRSIQSNYVYLVCSGDGTETTNYTCYFDDFGASGAINLNMDDYVIVTGVVDGDELFTDVVMKNCSFVKGYGSGSSTIYGNLNDAFGSVMDDIYGSGWRGIYGY